MNNNKITNSTRKAIRIIENGKDSELGTSEPHYFVNIFFNSVDFNKKASDNNGNSLLLSAIRNKNKPVACFLASDPEVINFKGSNGKPPSFGFMDNVDFEFIKYMVDRGLNINAVDNTGTTALHNLAIFGNENDYEIFHKLGADFSLKNTKGETPLDTARRYGKKIVISGVVNSPVKSNDSRLIDSAREEKINKIKNRVSRLKNISSSLEI